MSAVYWAVEHDVNLRVDEGIGMIIDAIDPEALAEDVADAVVDAIPELRRLGDEDLRLSMVATAAQAVVEKFDRVRSSATGDITVQPPAIALAHALVHRGVGIATLLRAYRIGHQVVEERWVEVAEELQLDPQSRWRVLSRASHVFFAYHDAICSQLTETYAEERVRWLRGAAAARADLVNALLGGQAVAAEQAGRTLDYDVTGHHVAFIVWSDPREADGRPPANLEVVARALASRLAGGPVLLVPVGESVVWGWCCGDRLADPAGDEPLAVPHGVWAAVGTPAGGVRGFVRSHEEAQATRRVTALLRRPSGSVVRQEGVSLVALLTSELGGARRFVEQELGDLLAPTEAMARLRATLRVYCEENASPARASRRLGVHQNTVVYRVDRAEAILGHALTDRRLEIEVALMLAESIDRLRAAEPPTAQPD
jgi:hypothetical protein